MDRDKVIQQFAKAAMQGMLAGGHNANSDFGKTVVIGAAVQLAELLMTELEERKLRIFEGDR